MSKFLEDIRHVINVFSKENESNTPDFILAKYLSSCLDAYGEAVTARDKWFEFEPWGGRDRVLKRNPLAPVEGDKFKIVATVNNDGAFVVHVDGRDVGIGDIGTIRSAVQDALGRLGFVRQELGLTP